MECYKTARSRENFEWACRRLAGGVASQVKSVSPYPVVFTHGKGSHLYDIDGNEYIDYLLGMGPSMLGHAHPEVTRAIQEEAKKGTLLGGPHPKESQLAEKIVRHSPSAELVRFGNSGSEAIHILLRLARAYTGKSKVLKFEGHYHGWYDNIFLSFHPGDPSEFGPREAPTTALGATGQPESVLQDVIAMPWNDLDLVQSTVARHARDLAAVIMEPIMSNCGVILPRDGYLAGVRDITRKHGVLLIFDEIITGFRVGLGGASKLFGVTPDLVAYSKSISAGLPMSCFGGRREIMELIADKKVVHAGGYNGNNVCIAAGLAAVEVIERDHGSVLKRMGEMGRQLMGEIQRIAAKHGHAIRVSGPGQFFCAAFTDKEVYDARDAFTHIDDAKYLRFRKMLLDRGMYIFTTQKGLWYMSSAHTDVDIEQTVVVLDEVFRLLD